MKQTNLKRVVNLAASVLAAGLLMGLLTGCPNGVRPKKPNEPVKPQKGITYRVEHRLQNAENDEYTLKETEEKSGKAGEDTAAAVKTYEGFKAKTVTQQKIKADSSTVVKIEYDRNMVTLKLNLNGGSTDTPIENGEGGRKLLKGKYGSKVKLENLKKGSEILRKWEPKLPETFPVSSPADTYTASWIDGYIVTIKGDERTEIADNTFIKANLNPIQTWNDIAAQVKVSLKTEWKGDDYEIYEWRLGDENGAKLTDGYRIDKHLTVYAVTNYAKAKFNIDSTGTKIKIRGDKGYSGGEPKGRIIIPDGITEIEDVTDSDWDKGAFNGCSGITSVKFPQSLKKIGKFAFVNCKGLTSINLPVNLEQIDKGAFTFCKGLTSLNLSGCTSLKQIGDRAFGECSGLTSLDLPANLEQIGEAAFSLCPDLKSINLPANLNQIGKAAFVGCTGLTSLTVDSGNNVYKAENNIVYTKDGGTLVCTAGGLTAATIPDKVTAIGEGAFSGCMSLKEVSLPASLNQIGKAAFVGCTGLERVFFADTENWKAGGSSIKPNDLKNPATAAQYLSKDGANGGYGDKEWKKN